MIMACLTILVNEPNLIALSAGVLEQRPSRQRDVLEEGAGCSPAGRSRPDRVWSEGSAPADALAARVCLAKQRIRGVAAVTVDRASARVLASLPRWTDLRSARVRTSPLGIAAVPAEQAPTIWTASTAGDKARRDSRAVLAPTAVRHLLLAPNAGSRRAALGTGGGSARLVRIQRDPDDRNVAKSIRDRRRARALWLRERLPTLRLGESVGAGAGAR
jgi:hypothetical protein